VEDGVDHVMRLFMRHATKSGEGAAADNPGTGPDYLAASQHIVDVECDEIALDRP
jgi:hypothetical protein